MKTILLISSLFLFQLLAFAQPPKKIKHYPPPPKVMPPPIVQPYRITTDENGKKLSAAGILLYNMDEPTFTWEGKNGTIILKDSLYRKTIYIHDAEQVRLDEDRVGSDTKLPMKDGIVYLKNGTLQWCTMKMNGDKISLYDKQKMIVGKYQFILNKSKSRILSLKDLNDGKVFLASQSTETETSKPMTPYPPTIGR